MNSKTALITIWIGIFTILFPVFSTLAEELDSTNYKILDVTTQGGGTAESDNFSTLMTVNDAVVDPSLYSTNYKLYGDPADAFRPAVPTVSCFETDTNGYSNCTTGPTELTEGGMVALCGNGGCHDRARFEIGDAPYQYDTSQSGLVSYWPMDETTGSTITDVSSSNDGTATGTTIVDGKYRNSRSFNGSSDYINVGNNPSLRLDSNSYTILSWIKHSSTNQSGVILSKRNWVSGSYRFRYDYTDGPRIRWHALYGGATQTVDYNVELTPDTWNQIGVIVENADSTTVNVSIILNGEIKITTQAAGPISGNDEVVDIGSLAGTSQQFAGLIDELLVFNRSLNTTEISNLYNNSRPTTNPSDTLYAVEISTDNFVSDIRYIDGSTNEPKSDLTLNDFRTKTAWETDTFNILGLQGSTEYDLRIIALHGDFTQTEEGPPASATTGQASCSFDIDIADESGTTAETDPPFNITFTGDNALLAGAGTVVADNLVWMDAETNGPGGFAIVQRGQNGGLYSPTLAAQINSVTGDLDALSEGFGLQSYYIDHATGTGLGTITAEINYSGSVSNVGIVDTDWNKVYDSSGPTVTGRMALYVMARAGSDKQGATDYQESITFILVPRY